MGHPPGGTSCAPGVAAAAACCDAYNQQWCVFVCGLYHRLFVVAAAAVVAGCMCAGSGLLYGAAKINKYNTMYKCLF